MNKKVISYGILPVLTLVLLGAGVSFTSAASTTTKPMDTLVTTIASKFNLNSSDVQKVVDQVMLEQRASMEAKREQSMKDRMASAVKNGKLTQAQADLITAKMTELKTKHDSQKNATMTPEERMTVMKTEMDSLKKWASDNKIPAGFMMMGMEKGGAHKPGHMGLGEKHGGMMNSSMSKTTTK